MSVTVAADMDLCSTNSPAPQAPRSTGDRSEASPPSAGRARRMRPPQARGHRERGFAQKSGPAPAVHAGAAGDAQRPAIATETPLRTFSAVYAVNGGMRRVYLTALDEAEARQQCARWGVGLEGRSTLPESHHRPLPEAYDAKTACQLCGGISMDTLYRWLAVGRLERVDDHRHILVTRESIEQGDWKRSTPTRGR